MKYILLISSLIFMVSVSFSYQRPTAGGGTLNSTAVQGICDYSGTAEHCQQAETHETDVDNEAKTTNLYQSKTSDATE